jgi:hypothetical protein
MAPPQKLPQSHVVAIKQLFRHRDEAIRKHDAELFDSTQLDNLVSSPHEFLTLKSLKTEIITCWREQKTQYKVAVFVKQDGLREGDWAPYSYLAVYRVVETSQGWKIYGLVYV